MHRIKIHVPSYWNETSPGHLSFIWDNILLQWMNIWYLLTHTDSLFVTKTTGVSNPYHEERYWMSYRLNICARELNQITLFTILIYQHYQWLLHKHLPAPTLNSCCERYLQYWPRLNTWFNLNLAYITSSCLVLPRLLAQDWTQVYHSIPVWTL